ncbi:hypothetical protein BDZ91DRAFT_422423 [Kalaharituber pfeilii]|nr:hypothetical protein BDZ91DRAFT_422423 [Kalaharituber pfeilii]
MESRGLLILAWLVNPCYFVSFVLYHFCNTTIVLLTKSFSFYSCRSQLCNSPSCGSFCMLYALISVGNNGGVYLTVQLK